MGKIPQEKRKYIQDLCRSGKSFHEIERITGITRKTVSQICHEVDIEFPDCTYSKIAENKDLVIQLRALGKTGNEIAEQIGCSSATVYNFCNKNGIKKPKAEEIKIVKELNPYFVSEDDIEKIKKLAESGLCASEIAREIMKSPQTISRITKKRGIYLIKKSAALNIDDRLKELILDGKCITEVGKILNVDHSTVREHCKKLGIKYERKKPEEINPPNSQDYVKEKIEKINNVTYLGGYKNNTSICRVQCNECGKIFERKYISLTQNYKKTCCPDCREKEVEARRFANYINRLELIRKKKEQDERRLKTHINKKAKKEQEKKELLSIDRVCEYCGEIFHSTNNNIKYCSKKCSNKASNRRKETKRRLRIADNFVEDVSLERLYERDKGICYLCGKKTDYKDYVIKDGAFIAGDLYPSMDHIVPLCEGGEHSYNNTKLAHRICNSKRYYEEKKHERTELDRQRDKRLMEKPDTP